MSAIGLGKVAERAPLECAWLIDAALGQGSFDELSGLVGLVVVVSGQDDWRKTGPLAL